MRAARASNVQDAGSQLADRVAVHGLGMCVQRRARLAVQVDYLHSMYVWRVEGEEWLGAVDSKCTGRDGVQGQAVGERVVGGVLGARLGNWGVPRCGEVR